MTKRQAISDKLKLESAVYWGTLRCAMCERIFIFEETIEWDHIHPLALGGENICINIRPLCKDCHKRKTFGSKATTLNSDIHAIAKAKRISNGGKRKSGKKIQSRGFPNRHRPMRPRLDP